MVLYGTLAISFACASVSVEAEALDSEGPPNGYGSFCNFDSFTLTALTTLSINFL